jgi:hypothetical protein
VRAATLRRAYLLEARLVLFVAALAIRIVPASWFLRLCDHRIPKVNRFATSELDWIPWAVESIASTKSASPSALAKALAVHAMLRRRRIASTLCLGYTRSKHTLTTRVWVEHGDRILVGEQDADHCVRMAAFGRH